MGIIVIETLGSFGGSKKTFNSAMKYGHAHCVNEAQEYLTEVMRKAINADHHLHEDGVKPENGFHKIESE